VLEFPYVGSPGSIPVPTQADGGQRRLTRVTAVASDFRGLRRVAYCRGAPGVGYESVALPLICAGVRPWSLPLPARPLRTASRQFQHPVQQRPGARFWRSRRGSARSSGADTASSLPSKRAPRSLRRRQGPAAHYMNQLAKRWRQSSNRKGAPSCAASKAPVTALPPDAALAEPRPRGQDRRVIPLPRRVAFRSRPSRHRRRPCGSRSSRTLRRRQHVSFLTSEP